MSADVVTKLLRRPVKDKSNQKARYIRGFQKDLVHQADLLSVYEDSGYKYILVVVDAGTRLFDAVPLKSKTSSDVLAAFKKIYGGKILKSPANLQVDKGTEFHGDVLKWFLSIDTQVRYGRTARHRQQALVEARNRSIATMLYKRMMQEEFITGQKSTEWVGFLPQVIQTLNNKTKAHNKELAKKAARPPPKRPVEIVLEQGTKVRPILEQPIGNLDGSPLTGHFRATDIRFDPEVRTIVQVMLHPGKPAMYVLNNPHSKQAAEVYHPKSEIKSPLDNEIENVAYTRNQLQVVTDDETYGDINDIVIDKKNKKFDETIAIAEKITGEVVLKNKQYYMVKYRGYPKPEAQPKKDFSNSNEHNRELIRVYLKSKK